MRGLAAFGIILAHVSGYLLLPGLVEDGELIDAPGTENLKWVGLLAALGSHGVSVFFLISGFLLYRPFVRQVSTDSRTLLVKEFYRNRLIRVFPLYLVLFVFAAFIAGLAVKYPGGEATADDYVGRMTDPLLIITNLTLTQSYIPEGQVTGLSASWTLVTELAFYALLPVFWIIARNLAPKMRWQLAALVPAAGIYLVSLCCRLFITGAALAADDGAEFLEQATWKAVLWRSFLTQGDLFAIGMAVAVLSVHRHAIVEGTDRDEFDRRVVKLAWPLLFIFCVIAIPTRAFLLDGAPIAVATGCLIAIMSYDKRKIARTIQRVFVFKPFHHTGVISYSLYLWHIPVIFFLREQFPSLRYDTAGGFFLAYATTLAVTFVLAEITYNVIEKPLLNRKRSMVAVKTS